MSDNNSVKKIGIYEMSEDGLEIIPVQREEYIPDDFSDKPSQWSVQGVWNQFQNVNPRPPRPYNFIRCSELGKDYWGRFMGMKGIEATNPFDNRVLRVFAAGDIFHDLVKNVFKSCGIFINSQDDLDENGKEQFSIIQGNEHRLNVIGHYDIKVGGKPSEERIIKSVFNHSIDIAMELLKEIRGKNMSLEDLASAFKFSDFIVDRTRTIIKKLNDTYPNGLKEMLYDVKSINSQAFWGKRSYLGEAYPHHQLQLYAYLKANNISDGRVLYVSKDDLSVQEFSVIYPTERLEQLLEKDVSEMSHYYLNDIEPPKPKSIVFDERKTLSFTFEKKKYKMVGCHTMNWEVSRNAYFQILTGCKTPDEWEDKHKVELKTLNDARKEKLIERLKIEKLNAN